MKKIIAALALLFVLAVGAFGQTDAMLNLREHSNLFLNNRGNLDVKYAMAVSDEDFERIAVLGGSETRPDTPLEIALLSTCAGVADIRPAEANAMLGNARQADQKLGAAVFQEIQILRFLNASGGSADTAAVNRHEAVLQFITGRGNATRAEIEAFYRNNIRGLVSQVVDEEFAGITVPAATLAEIKQVIGDFFVTPTQTTFDGFARKGIYANALRMSIIELDYWISIFSDPILLGPNNPEIINRIDILNDQKTS